MSQQETLVQHQIELEKTFSKNQQIPRIKEEVLATGLDFEAHFKEFDIPYDFGIDLLIQMILHKRANLNTLVGILYRHFDNAQETADAIKRSIDAGLVSYDDTLRIFIVIMDISPVAQLDLDRYQYPLPMVVPPKPILSNNDSGYLNGKSSVILRNNHHDDDVCLDHLNRMNRVKLSINWDVVRMVKNKWKNLDRMKVGETRLKYEQRVRAFQKYDQVAHEVMARLTEHGNEFYLTHRYDKRGRTYSQGYHVNYQGNPWNKAVIEFADKEICE